MKKLTLPTLCVLIGALSPAQARYGHFQGFYAGLNVGHQSVNTHYNFANAQFGNITPLSIIQTNIPSVGDTTTIKTSAVYSNGSGSFLQRGMTGGVTLGGGYVLNSFYVGIEAEGSYAFGVDATSVMVENVGTITTSQVIAPGASSSTQAANTVSITYYDLTSTVNWKPKMRLAGALRFGYLITPKVMVFVAAGLARSNYTLTYVNTLFTANSAVFGNGKGSNVADYVALNGATQVTTATGAYANLALTPRSSSAQATSVLLGLGAEIALGERVNLKMRADYEMGQNLAKTLNLKPSVLGFKVGLAYYF